MSAPPCAGLWMLFDSTNSVDHMEARAICKGCHMRDKCADLANIERRDSHGRSLLTGTWAGHLYGANSKERISIEDGMFTEAEARKAHAAWMRAKPINRNRHGVGELVVIGERVYQRRAQRRRQVALVQRRAS